MENIKKGLLYVAIQLLLAWLSALAAIYIPVFGLLVGIIGYVLVSTVIFYFTNISTTSSYLKIDNLEGIAFYVFVADIVLLILVFAKMGVEM